MRFAGLLPCFLVVTLLTGSAEAGPKTSPTKAARLVEQFTAAIERVNRAHLASPGKAVEADLAKKLPASARKVLPALLAMDDGEAKWKALVGYAAAAADLDLIADLEKIERALRKRAPRHAEKLGHYVSRKRFLLRALRTQDAYAKEFADALDGILKVYDKTFGFAEFSKVPGKKIRVLLHRDEKASPPHFAPEFPFHSGIDFPIVKDEAFHSPTPDGRFLFYGLCHELGHLIAMWGNRGRQEDHHAWAHYTGIVIVDACEKQPWTKALRDRRWRSVEIERKGLENVEAGTGSRDEVLKLLIALHDLVGPKRIGAALNLMDEKAMGHRINHVRYYGFADLGKALRAGSTSGKEKKRLARLGL